MNKYTANIKAIGKRRSTKIRCSLVAHWIDTQTQQPVLASEAPRHPRDNQMEKARLAAVRLFLR